MLSLLMILSKFHQISYLLIIERIVVAGSPFSASDLIPTDFIDHDLMVVNFSDIYLVLSPVFRYATQHFLR